MLIGIDLNKKKIVSQIILFKLSSKLSNKFQRNISALILD